MQAAQDKRTEDAGQDSGVMLFPVANTRIELVEGRSRDGEDRPLSPLERQRLEILRDLAVGSRLTRKRDPFCDCRLSDLTGVSCPRRCSLAFFRLLGPTASRRLGFHVPGSASVTLDERWLLRLLERIEADDVDSARALIAFRISRVHRRRMLAAAIEFEAKVQELEMSLVSPI